MPNSHIVTHAAELLALAFAIRPEVKKSTVRQWLKHGVIQVNGHPTTRYNHALKVGDVVAFATSRDAPAANVLPGGLKVLFEDDSLIVVDKPSNLLSMASETERRKTAYAYLTDYVRRGSRGTVARVWIVHRLDRETSGLMVFARTEVVQTKLQSNWRQVDKRYLAIVEGRPPDDDGVLISHLDESGPFKVYSAPRAANTRRAVTNYRVVRRHETRALVELTPETGRRNQIRVHLADAACPIVGDRKYGARTDPARRLGLHASSLQFDHPASGERLRFVSPLPPELAGLV